MINYSNEYIDAFQKVWLKAISQGISEYDAARMALTWHETEQAVVWDTTCAGCARLLDRLYERDVEDGKI